MSYKGYIEVDVTDSRVNEFYQDTALNVFDLGINEYLLFLEDGEVVDSYKWIGTEHVHVSYKTLDNEFTGKVKPRNEQQKLAFDLLQDSRSKIKVIDGGYGCRPIGTKYLTSLGWRTGEEITGDETVMGPYGPVKVLAYHNVGVKETVILTYSDGYVEELTADHKLRIFTENGIEWKKAGDLTSDDSIIVNRNPQGFDGCAFDVDKAYLIGYLYGDGYAYTNNVKSFVGICYNPKYKYLTELCEQYGLTKSVYVNPRNHLMYRTTSSKNTTLFDDLEGMGKSKDSTKRIPDWLFNVSLDAKRAFIAGLWDSDGYVSPDGDEIELVTKCGELAQQVSSLLRELGIYCKITDKLMSKGPYKGNVYKRICIRNNINRVRFRDNIPLRMDYKKEALSKVVFKDNSNNRTILFGVAPYVKTKKHNSYSRDFYKRLPSRVYNLVKKSCNANTSLEALFELEKYFPEMVDDNLKYLIDNNCTTVTVVRKEFSMKECGDIEVEGHEYIYAGRWNHNTGKDYLMINHALHLIEKGKFKKILWVRNNIEVKNTKPIGYLPGSQNQKLLPYAMILADHLGGQEGLERMMDSGAIEIAHLGLLRGRSIRDTIIYCSEAENLTRSHVQLLIGRVDEGSELWMNGDYRQADAKEFEEDNGLKAAIYRLRGEPLFGYVHLEKVERSEVARLADKLD